MRIAALQRGMGRRLRLFASAVGVGVRRTRRSPGLATLMLAGTLLTVAIAAATPIYLQAIRDVGLDRVLADASPGSLDLRFETDDLGASPAPVASLEGDLDREVSAAAGTVATDTSTYLRTATFVAREPSEPFSATGAGRQAFVQWQSGFETLVELVDGTLEAAWDGAGAMPVLIAQAGAEASGVGVGDDLLLQPFWLAQRAETAARVVGVFAPRDAADPRWVGPSRQFASPGGDLALWAPRATLLESLPAHAPQMRVSLVDVHFVDTAGISEANARPLEERLRVLARRIAERAPTVRQTTALPDLLTDFRARFTFAESTLLVIAVQVAAIAVLALVIASAMSAEHRTEDLAWLRSRGAGRPYTVVVQLTEATLTTLPAVVAGPLIALGLVALLGYVSPFDSFTQDGLLPVRLPAEAYWLALATGAAAAVAQFVPAFRAARATIATVRRARSRVVQSWQVRVLTDGAIVALAALLLVELRRDTSTISAPVTGEASLDALGVATPAILVGAVGLIALRLFPLGVRAAATLAGRVHGAAPLLAGFYVSRAPSHYGRVVLLLVALGAVAVFAAAFKATLERSYADRAAYAVGADLRLTGAAARSRTASETAARLDAAGVVDAAGAVASVLRFDARLAGDDSGSLTLLAADTGILADIGFFRDDFSSRPLPDALADLAADPGPALPVVPAASGTLDVWLRAERVSAGTSVLIRLVDAQDRYWEYVVVAVEEEEREAGELFVQPDQRVPLRLRDGLGAIVATDDQLNGWVLAQVSLQRPAFTVDLEGRRRLGFLGRPANVAPAPGELRVVGLYIARRGRQAERAGAIGFDDIVYSDAERSVVVADLGADASWEAVPPSALQASTERLAPTDGRSAGDALLFEWDATAASDVGLRPERGRDLTPALLHESVLRRAGREVGDAVRLRVGNVSLDLRAEGVFSRFPTHDASDGDGLVVIDRAALTGAILAGTALTGIAQPDSEIWIALGGVAPDAALAALGLDAGDPDVASRAGRRAAIEDDPLVVAAWNGLFVGALAAVAVAGAYALSVLTVLGARARRTEFAVLRSIGLRPRQVLTLVAIEQIVVLLVGLGLGIALGFAGHSVLLDLFALTPEGRQVLPPLAFRVDWTSLGVVLAGAGGLLLLTLAGSLLALRRIELQRALRGAA